VNTSVGIPALSRLAVVAWGDDDLSCARFVEPAEYDEIKIKIDDYNS
jgi:hypothetical protein